LIQCLVTGEWVCFGSICGSVYLTCRCYAVYRRSALGVLFLLLCMFPKAHRRNAGVAAFSNKSLCGLGIYQDI
jgi:hypothetical protein